MPSWMDQGIAGIQKYDPVYGAGDTILGLGSHMLHGAARGFGGLITLGMTGDSAAATDAIQNYQAPSWLPEYHVQSGLGKGVMSGMEWFFTGYDAGVKQFTDLVAKGESPFIPKAIQGPKLASLMYTGYMAIPLSIGLVRGQKGPLPVTGYDKTSIRNAIKNHAAMYRDSAVMSKIFREANPKLWEKYYHEGTLSKHLKEMGRTMEKATLQLNVVVDKVSRSTARATGGGESGALGVFHPPRGTIDSATQQAVQWAPEAVTGRLSSRKPSIAEKNIHQEYLETVFKDSKSDFILFETTNMDILKMFNERVGYDSKAPMQGYLGSRHMIDVPSGTPKEMASWITDTLKAKKGGLENANMGFMLIKVPKGMTKETLLNSSDNKFFNMMRLRSAEGGNRNLSTAERNIINDGVRINWDWGETRYGPPTGKPILMGSIQGDKLYAPKGTHYSQTLEQGGFKSRKEAAEGGPVIALNPFETLITESRTTVPGVGRLNNPSLTRPSQMSDAQVMATLRNIFGEDIAALSESALKRKWKEVLNKFEDFKVKRNEMRGMDARNVQTLEHELVHWRDYLEQMMLGKESGRGQGMVWGDTFIEMPKVRDWRGNLRDLNRANDLGYRSGNNPAMVKLSNDLLGAYEKHKWNFNIKNEAHALNKTYNFTTNKWAPTSKKWSELTKLEKDKIFRNSEMYNRLNPIELVPRLRELALLQQKTGKPLSEIFDLRRDPGQRTHFDANIPQGVRDLDAGIRHLVTGDLTQWNILASDPAKWQAFLAKKLDPLIEFTNLPPATVHPAGMNIAGGAAIPVMIDQPKPEWQGMINAGTNQITAGKLSAAGME